MKSWDSEVPKSGNVLYLDDDSENLFLFRRAFGRYYTLFLPRSAAEAFQMLRENDIHVVIADQVMPGMTGVEFLEQVLKHFPSTERIILTASTDIDTPIQAINRCKIFQYVLKPWDYRALHLVIDKAVSMVHLSKRNIELIDNLTKTNEALERKVDDRTLELLKLNKFKDKILSIISHDLRSPLNALDSFMSMFVKYHNAFSKEELDKLGVEILDHVRNTRYLLDNLFSWSVSQFENEKIEIKKIDLRTIIQNISDLMQSDTHRKHIDFKCVMPSTPCECMGDENVVSLIIRNLLHNAIKFTPEKGKIRIVLAEKAQFFDVRIQDTGMGMSRESIERIFSNEQIHSTKGTANEVGSGLGLKFCRDFSERMQGNLSIESSKEVGTVVSFCIPKVGIYSSTV